MFKISLSGSEESFLCSSDQVVLNAMAALGRKSIPSGCHGGGCGVCKIQVLEGEFKKLTMSRQHVSEDEEADGVALACRVLPETDLKLKIIGKFKKKVYAFNTGVNLN